MKKLILCVFAFFASQTAYAAEERSLYNFDREQSLTLEDSSEETEIETEEYQHQDKAPSNNCCHNCRLSKSRKLLKSLNYKDCPNCKMTFCQRCYAEDKELIPCKIEGCVVCQKQCCCCYEECNIEHDHCFTYNRRLNFKEKKDSKEKRKRSDEENQKKEGESEQKKEKLQYTVRVEGLSLFFSVVHPEMRSFL